jgi:hypothetical protein
LRWTTTGDPRVRPEHAAEPARLELVPAPTYITAALFCPDCLEWHDLRVIVDGGRIPTSVCLAIGLGGGWWYRLTDEDRGSPEGLSIPVYRATISIQDARVAEFKAQQSGVTH